jgi:hypothetical protein
MEMYGAMHSNCQNTPVQEGVRFYPNFLAYRTVWHPIVPDRNRPSIVLKSTASFKRNLVLKTQFSVYRRVPKMHFIPFFNTEKLYEREP